MSVYYLIIFGKFKLRLYVNSLKSDKRWSLTRTYEKAYRFDYPHYANMAIKDYCHMYGSKENDFKVIKIIEEDISRYSRIFGQD